MQQNSLRAWVLAARPKTLSGAAVPVMVGGAYAWRLTDGLDFNYLALALCFLFAFVMQIEANFVNDYFDCIRGRDNEERLGPLRACQQGWISLSAMRIAMGVTLVVAGIIGLPLVLWGGWQLVVVGVACMLFCFLYTTVLSGVGMGDVLVFLFFGLVPVVFTTYVCVPSPLQQWALMPWALSLATGLMVDTLLLVNNFRDIDGDRNSGKCTLVVLIGRKATLWLYFIIVPVALLINKWVLGYSVVNVVLFLIVLAFHCLTHSAMVRIGSGRELNKVLAMTARNILIYGLCTAFAIILT